MDSDFRRIQVPMGPHVAARLDGVEHPLQRVGVALVEDVDLAPRGAALGVARLSLHEIAVDEATASWQDFVAAAEIRMICGWSIGHLELRVRHFADGRRHLEVILRLEAEAAGR